MILFILVFLQETLKEFVFLKTRTRGSSFFAAPRLVVRCLSGVILNMKEKGSWVVVEVVASMKTEELTDEEIVRKITGGDIDAFGTLVERYEPKLSRYAKRFLFDREDIQDLLQEVFVKAYQNIRSFDLSRRFSPWIYRIAHNEFVNALKRRERMPFTFFDPDLLFPHLAAPETADDLALHNELRTLLDTHLSALDAKYREPLVLFYFEELDYQEIADVLKIPPATVGVRLRRGKALLRSMMHQEA